VVALWEDLTFSFPTSFYTLSRRFYALFYRETLIGASDAFAEGSINHYKPTQDQKECAGL